MTEYHWIGNRECRIHTVTPEQLAEATEAGTTRRDYHRNLGSTKHYYDPEQGEYKNEIYGCLGEVGFRDIVIRNGLGPVSRFYPLYSIGREELGKKANHDAEIETKTIEVKSIIPPSGHKKRILVKLSEYKKGIDFYVAVKFINDNEYVLAGFCTDEELRINTPRSFGQGGDCYWIYLKDLHHMKKNWWRFEEEK